MAFPRAGVVVVFVALCDRAIGVSAVRSACIGVGGIDTHASSSLSFHSDSSSGSGDELLMPRISIESPSSSNVATSGEFANMRWFAGRLDSVGGGKGGGFSLARARSHSLSVHNNNKKLR